MRNLWFLAICLALLVGCGSNSDNSKETTKTAPPLCEKVYIGPARGLSCLHCTQKEARNQALETNTLLLRSCIQNIAINYLVDGSFDFDQAFLEQSILDLTEDGRNLFVTFYLANGPAQRRWDITEIDGFGTRISPVNFRELIQRDPVIQEDYRNLVRRLIPIIELGVSRGAYISIIPVLEDNLTNAAFNAMYQLTLESLPSELPVAIGRNACIEPCYPGNEGGIPLGVFEEVHTSTPLISIRDGIISNDGIDYESPGTGPNPRASVSLDALRVVRDAAEAANNTFILWSARAQGLPAGIENSKFPLPHERVYKIPNAAEQQEILHFLRGNIL